MSEDAFYDLIKRYSEEESLKDKSSKPKNPAHKLSQEEKQTIINKAREEREKIKALQSAFETDMQDLGTGYVFGLLDMHNDAFVTLTGHPEKNGDINSAFGYRKPLEVMATKISNLPQQVGGH